MFTFEVVRQLFPEAMSTSCGVCRCVSCPCSTFSFGSLFRGTLYAFSWCTSKLLFSETLGAGLGVASLLKIITANDSVSKIAILDLVLWIILSNRRYLDCVSNTCDNALSEESCNYHGVFFVWIFTERIQKCEEDCLSASVVFLSTRNQSTTTSVKDILFPVVGNRRVSRQFWHCRNTTRVFMNCSQVTQGIFVIHSIFNSSLTAAFMKQMNPTVVCECYCSISCKRLQQHPSHGLPVIWSVLFWFVLIVMTYHLCKHLGDLYRQICERLASITINFKFPYCHGEHKFP